MSSNLRNIRKFNAPGTFDPLHKVGIEIEVESQSISVDRVYSELDGTMWMLDPEEGSLRAGSYGWEVKLQVPTMIHNLPAALAALYPVLQHSSGTWRAAVHCHVDANGLGNIRSVLGLAYLLDKCIFREFSPHRVESNFAVPLSNTPADIVQQMEWFAASRHSLVETMTKYRSVNFEAIQKFGSIEFRHMETPKTDGSVSSVGAAISRIHKFALTCAKIVLAGASVKAEDIMSVVPSSQLGMRYYGLGTMYSDQDLLTVLQGMGCINSKPSGIDHDLHSLFSAVGGSYVPQSRVARVEGRAEEPSVFDTEVYFGQTILNSLPTEGEENECVEL